MIRSDSSRPPDTVRGMMTGTTESESRKLLGRLREALAGDEAGQARLDRITEIIACSMSAEVCSIYLFRDPETLELCATEGLELEAVHQTRMRLGEGLVGRVARMGQPINTPDAPSEHGFRYMPETGEERYSSFLGVPIQRLGERLGVLVVQSKDKREFSEDAVYALEVVAMVLAEMTELGAFTGEGEALKARHKSPAMFRGVVGQEGSAVGHVWLHEPRVLVTKPIADDSEAEVLRLHDAIEQLREALDLMVNDVPANEIEQREVLEAYRMFAHSRSWLKRMEEDVRAGLSAEAAVEKEQSAARARMKRVPDAYLRDRLQDLDDLSNRLLRILTGQGHETGAEMPPDPILVARHIGPGDLLDYGRKLKGVVLEEGSVGSHATIVARAWAIPLVLNATGITTEALNGDAIAVDGDQGIVHLRPEDNVRNAFDDKMQMKAEAQKLYADLRDKPARALCGTVVELQMNAGLMADLPSLEGSGAEGVGLFRTELQFLTRNKVPQRGELAALYSRVLDAAKGKRVVFRTLDIGSDKVLPYMKPQDEPNPAMGWRAIRVALDRKGVMRMQLQALIRAAEGRPLTVEFPFIAQLEEFREAKAHMLDRARAGGADGPRPARAGRDRRHAGDAEPGLRAALLLRDGGLRLDRRQRPQAVLLCRRPRERAGAPALRRAERQLPDADRDDRRPLRRSRHAAELLRRGCGAAGGSRGAGGDGTARAVDAPRLDRPGQEPAAPRQPGGGARSHRRGARQRRAVGPTGDRDVSRPPAGLIAAA